MRAARIHAFGPSAKVRVEETSVPRPRKGAALVRVRAAAAIARLVEKGVVRPHITKVLPLSRASRAMDLNEHGRSHGKVVLRVA